jgi:hypothetical protein
LTPSLCDTVSSFTGRGKKTAWETWKALPEVTEAYAELADNPASIEDHIHLLERFVILMYDKTSDTENINETRKQLFTQKGRDIQAIPPTHAAFVQHAKRAVYQGGHCWGKIPNFRASAAKSK